MTLRRFALAAVIALIGASALAFGSVEDWTTSWLRCALLVVAAALVASGASVRSLGRPAVALLVPVLAIVALGFLQSIPVGTTAIRSLSPRWAALRAEIVPASANDLPRFLVAKAVAKGATLQPGASMPRTAAVPRPVDGGSALSVAPQTTRRAALTWLIAAMGLACGAVLARRPGDLYTLLWALAGWSGVLGVIAVVTRVSGTSTLLGLRNAPTGANVLGPFVNPDHFAAFVEMGVLAACGIALAILSSEDGRLTVRSIRRSVLDREWALPRLLVLAGCITMGLGGLVLSRSRAGAIALAVGLIAIAAARRMKRTLAVLLVSIVIAGLAVGVVSRAAGSGGSTVPPLAAASSDASLGLRWEMWGRTVRIFEDFPVVGTGLGTFKDIYAAYDRPGEWMATNQAHNDYLQLLAETGVIGVALLLWAVVVFTRRVIRPISRSEAGWRFTTAGCFGAVIALLVHTMFDFSLQTPAVALQFAVLVGLLCAVASEAGAAPERQA